MRKAGGGGVDKARNLRDKTDGSRHFTDGLMMVFFSAGMLLHLHIYRCSRAI